MSRVMMPKSGLLRRAGAGVIRFGAWTLVGSTLFAAGACAGSTEDDAAGGSGGSPAGGSGGATPGSGGSIPGTGGTGGTAPGTGGALGGAGGGGGGGGSDDACALPFEGGPCEAAILVYFHNPATERCEPATYGGCGGNGNRFETFAECESACQVVPTGPACEVNDVVYPDGFTPVPDPVSCNTCTCSAGTLDSCTEALCLEPCPEGSVPGRECASCAPNDACDVVRTGCLPACDAPDDCAEVGGFCDEGACRMLCG